MKKIAFIGTDNKLSGATLSMIALAKSLKDTKKYDPIIIIPGEGDIVKNIKENNLKYYCVNSYSWVVKRSNNIKEKIVTGIKFYVKSFLNIFAIKKIEKILKEEKVDLIHINSIYSYVGAKAALKNNSTGCYKHLLAHLLDYKGGSNFNYNYDYKTSYTDPNSGTTETIQIDTRSGSTGATMHRYVKDDPNWLEIVNAINDTSRVCDGDDNYNGTSDSTKDNIIQQAIDEGRVPTKTEILQSDYLYDPDTNTVTGVKTLKQKAIDLLYMLNNLSEFDVDWKATLINFTDGDMKNLGSPPTPPDPFTGVKPDKPTEPEEPQKPDYSVELNDQEKAQWYVNLWYMMNGSDTANIVKEDTSTDLDGIFIVESAEKSSKGNYKVLEDNLMTSPEWIEFALEHGIVTLVKAEYTNPSEDSGKAPELTSDAITWSATTVGSCIDISSTEDEVAVAKAEAEYNQKLREIESKDKKYDNDLKKLDTEHNALQTEYESVKSVIEKNTERSFKAFS